MDATNPAHVAGMCLVVAMEFVVGLLLFQFADWLTKRMP
jgi:hypothetical protein